MAEQSNQQVGEAVRTWTVRELRWPDKVTGEEHVIAQLDDLTEDERASEAWEETPVAALPDLLSLLEDLADGWEERAKSCIDEAGNFSRADGLFDAACELHQALTSIQGSEA